MISSLNPIPTLPNYTGPYSVGSTEFEIPISEIEIGSRAPNAQITTIKFRLYYPTQSAVKKSISWLPSPQKQWTEAYALFLGASTRFSSFISNLPSLVHYATIPAIPDAPISPPKSNTKYPLTIFSHGLGGNFNTYSAICGSLASYGIVCAAPEHRDGSAPISLIRSANGTTSAAIPYQRHSHAPSAEVLNARNAQLRIRLWELELLYSALEKINDGQALTNYAVEEGKQDLPALGNVLDMTPGMVTWAGHSFGAASIVQLVKSVYHYQSLPSLEESPFKDDPAWQPLCKPAPTGKLVKQITPSSPIALLDLWTMPLCSESTQWLWEKALPCYDRQPSESDATSRTNTVAVMSSDFYKWKELRNRTQALLSPVPAEAMKRLERSAATAPTEAPERGRPPVISTEIDKIPVQIERDSTPSSVRSSSASSCCPTLTSSVSSAPSFTSIPSAAPAQPKLFMVPSSAHLSQSDFGVLFPKLTRYFMKAQEPHETLELNVRAILAIMRGRGLAVAVAQKAVQHHDDDEKEREDEILSDKGNVKRWVAVPLAD